MATPEGKVKQFVNDFMRKYFPNAEKYSPPGMGRFGKNGMPDKLWWIRATDDICISVAIETKAPGKKATPLQISRLKSLRANGVICAVVIGKDKDKMERIKDEILRRIQLANQES